MTDSEGYFYRGVPLLGGDRVPHLLGHGVDPLDELAPFEQVFEYDASNVDELVQYPEGHRDVKFTTQICTSYRDLYEASGRSIHAEARGFGVRGSASFTASRTARFTDDNLVLVIKAVDEFPRRRLKDLKLRPEVLNDAKTLTHENFAAKYGTHAIVAERRGIEVGAVVTIKIKSVHKTKSESLAAAVSANFGLGGGSVKATATSLSTEGYGSSDVTFEFFAKGGKGVKALTDAETPNPNGTADELFFRFGSIIRNYIRDASTEQPGENVQMAVPLEQYAIPLAPYIAETDTGKAMAVQLGLRDRGLAESLVVAETLLEQDAVLRSLANRVAVEEQPLGMRDGPKSAGTIDHLRDVVRTRLRFATSYFDPRLVAEPGDGNVGAAHFWRRPDLYTLRLEPPPAKKPEGKDDKPEAPKPALAAGNLSTDTAAMLLSAATLDGKIVFEGDKVKDAVMAAHKRAIQHEQTSETNQASKTANIAYLAATDFAAHLWWSRRLNHPLPLPGACVVDDKILISISNVADFKTWLSPSFDKEEPRFGWQKSDASNTLYTKVFSHTSENRHEIEHKIAGGTYSLDIPDARIYRIDFRREGEGAEWNYHPDPRRGYDADTEIIAEGRAFRWGRKWVGKPAIEIYTVYYEVWKAD